MCPPIKRTMLNTIRDNRRKRFVVRADEKLTAFLELDSAIRAAECPQDCGGREIRLDKLSRMK